MLVVMHIDTTFMQNVIDYGTLIDAASPQVKYI